MARIETQAGQTPVLVREAYVNAGLMSTDLMRNEGHNKALIREAYRVGARTGNLLLFEYADKFCETLGIAPSGPIIRVRKDLEAKEKEGAFLRWFDTALPRNGRNPRENLRMKIKRTLANIKDMEAGTAYPCVVLVPAKDEESEIGNLLSSIAAQRTSRPVMVVVTDDDSQDGTRSIAHDYGASVVSGEGRGIGPARRSAFMHTHDLLRYHPTRLLLFQTDADCVYKTSDVIQKVSDEYENESRIIASVGPSSYSVTLPSGQERQITSGQEYLDVTGTKGMRKLFEENGYDIADYLKSKTGPYYYIPGPNAVFRQTAFIVGADSYRADNWDSLDISIRLQTHYQAGLDIRYLPQQEVEVSPRAFVNEAGMLTEEMQHAFHELGYIPPFKAPHALPPSQTLFDRIRSIDREKERRRHAW